MIDLTDYRSILSLISDEILLITVENRGGKAQVFVGEIKEAIERAIKAEAENAKLRAALSKLARLGNEPNYGNSDGNMIARQALADCEKEGE